MIDVESLLVSVTTRYYAHLDDRANDLRTTTLVTQLLSDEYDNNSGSTTAAKTLVSFRPDFDLEKVENLKLKVPFYRIKKQKTTSK